MKRVSAFAPWVLIGVALAGCAHGGLLDLKPNLSPAVSKISVSLPPNANLQQAQSAGVYPLAISVYYPSGVAYSSNQNFPGPISLTSNDTKHVGFVISSTVPTVGTNQSSVVQIQNIVTPVYLVFDPCGLGLQPPNCAPLPSPIIVTASMVGLNTANDGIINFQGPQLNSTVTAITLSLPPNSGPRMQAAGVYPLTIDAYGPTGALFGPSQTFSFPVSLTSNDSKHIQFIISNTIPAVGTQGNAVVQLVNGLTPVYVSFDPCGFGYSPPNCPPQASPIVLSATTIGLPVPATTTFN